MTAKKYRIIALAFYASVLAIAFVNSGAFVAANLLPVLAWFAAQWAEGTAGKLLAVIGLAGAVAVAVAAWILRLTGRL